VTPPLPGPLAHLAPLLQHDGYGAVFLLVLLDNMLIPVPGQTILIAAAVYAGAGRLNIVALMAVALVAAILGDWVGYLIGRSGGRALVQRFGRYLLLPPDRFARAEDLFARHGGKVVTFARFIDGLRQTNGVLAGATRLPWRRFALFNALGAALWVGVWAGAGYAAGTDVGPIYALVSRYQLYVLAAVVAVVVCVIARQLVRRRRAEPSERSREP
jgi:membrane protein DedA with SNARE-associated domain